MSKTFKRTQRTPYSDKLVDDICAELALGKSVKEACASVENGPHPSTFWDWLLRMDAVAEKYARAKSMAADVYVDEIIQIADDGARDKRLDADGKEIVDYDHIQRSRLRVDARKWAASKIAPKKYGDRLQHANDPDNPMPVMVMPCVKLGGEDLEYDVGKPVDGAPIKP